MQPGERGGDAVLVERGRAHRKGRPGAGASGAAAPSVGRRAPARGTGRRRGNARVDGRGDGRSLEASG